nr:MAG TPA: hypothetical protein [Caudoviricetes sp.]
MLEYLSWLLLEYIHRLVMYIYLIVYMNLNLPFPLCYFVLTCHYYIFIFQLLL